MPVANALASVVYGFFYGLWPIAWIIIAAVFVYKISVKTGQFDIIRSSILSITLTSAANADRRFLFRRFLKEPQALAHR
ncbi:MAG: L-lactate permease [Escherichia sp.]